MHVFIYSMVQGAHNGAKTSFFSGVYLLSSDCFSVLNRNRQQATVVSVRAKEEIQVRKGRNPNLEEI